MSHNKNKEETTKVVIVGSGPSALLLSMALDGWEPYYVPKHPDRKIHELLFNHTNKSALPLFHSGPSSLCGLLKELDLKGQSHNPVALLIDSLFHPCADSIYDAHTIPSCLQLKKTGIPIPHIIIGNDAPGGSWVNMPPNMRTVSPGFWMDLPGPISLYQYLKSENLNLDLNERMERRHLTNYYRTFSEKILDLQNHYKYGVVQSIDKHNSTNSTDGNGWKVTWSKKETVEESNDNTTTSTNNITTSNVVLATGTYGTPRKLNISGEDFPWVVHRASDIPESLRSPFFNKINNNNKHKQNEDVLIVVGAGLSSADAIIRALISGIRVLHVFRTNTDKTKLAKMFTGDQGMYKDESYLVNLMSSNTTNSRLQQQQASAKVGLNNYVSFPLSRLSAIKNTGECVIKSSTSEGEVGAEIENIVMATQVAILIGSEPDLEFINKSSSSSALSISSSYEEARSLIPNGLDGTQGPKPTHPVWVDVDPLSFCVKIKKDSHAATETGREKKEDQVLLERSLFAIGALRGDNFLRFLIGDAFSVAATLRDDIISNNNNNAAAESTATTSTNGLTAGKNAGHQHEKLCVVSTLDEEARKRAKKAELKQASITC